MACGSGILGLASTCCSYASHKTNEKPMKKILVADDEPGVRALLSAILSRERERPYEVLFASDGEEALQMARSEHPDMLLLDIRMPKMSGHEVCRELRADSLTSHMGIVMITALSRQSDREEAMAAGADDLLTKPFSAEAILEKVQQMLGAE